MEKDWDSLEALVDSTSLSAVLAALEEICYAKAAHLQENWQDHKSGRMWERNARLCRHAADRVSA